jgi:hypothetical protein
VNGTNSTVLNAATSNVLTFRIEIAISGNASALT